LEENLATKLKPAVPAADRPQIPAAVAQLQRHASATRARDVHAAGSLRQSPASPRRWTEGGRGRGAGGFAGCIRVAGDAALSAIEASLS